MASFYKHDIASWMDGTERLSSDAYRAYHIIVQLIMLNESMIEYNERGLAGRCNMTIRRLRKALDELAETGKISIENGKIFNKRADFELQNLRKQRENSSKGGKNASELRETGEFPKASEAEIRNGSSKPLKNNDVDPSALGSYPCPKTRLEKTRREEKREDNRIYTPLAAASIDEPDCGSIPVEAGPADRMVERPQPAPSSKPGEPRTQNRGTRLPPDWELGQAEIADARSAGLLDAAIRPEWDKFRDYWSAKAGKDAVKLDWPATWRNWCRNAVQYGAKSPQTRSVGTGIGGMKYAV